MNHEIRFEIDVNPQDEDLQTYLADRASAWVAFKKFILFLQGPAEVKASLHQNSTNECKLSIAIENWHWAGSAQGGTAMEAVDLAFDHLFLSDEAEDWKDPIQAAS